MGETVHATETETEVQEQGGLGLVSHAGFIPRLVAYVLDTFLLLIPAIAYLQATGPVTRLVGLGLPFVVGTTEIWLVWGFFTGGTLVYFSVLEAYAGRTVGKRITGIRVSSLRMEDCTPVQALIRNFYRALYHLPLAGIAILALDGYLVLVHGRRVGDLAAETLVVKVPDEW